MYRCSIGSFFVIFNMRFYCSKRSKQSSDKVEISKTIGLITMIIIGVLVFKGLAFLKTFFMEEQLLSVTYNAAILPKLLVNIHAMCLPTLIFAVKRVVNHNFEARYKSRNKKVAEIRLLHWNKGSSYLENKMNEWQQQVINTNLTFLEFLRHIFFMIIFPQMLKYRSTKYTSVTHFKIIKSLKTIQVRAKYAPWLSEETKTAIQYRNRAQQSLRTCKDQDRSRHYKNLRNKVTNMLRRDKKLWEKSRLNYIIHNSANLWKSIKGMMAWKSNGPPQQLFYRGKLLNSPKALAFTMNEFFLEKISNLQARLPPTVGDPLVHLKKIMSDRKCFFQFKVVHPDEVMKIVTGLNNTKSSGLDEIDVFTVKLIIDDILPALTHIVNLSLNSSTFPMEWKASKVIPLIKKGVPIIPKITDLWLYCLF